MTENADLIDNHEEPAKIPNRPLRPSELLEMKMLAIEAKSHLEYLSACIKTFNLEKRFTPEPYDLTGKFCDLIINFCKEELKKTDVKKKRQK